MISKKVFLLNNNFIPSFILGYVLYSIVFINLIIVKKAAPNSSWWQFFFLGANVKVELSTIVLVRLSWISSSI